TDFPCFRSSAMVNSMDFSMDTPFMRYFWTASTRRSAGFWVQPATVIQTHTKTILRKPDGMGDLTFLDGSSVGIHCRVIVPAREAKPWKTRQNVRFGNRARQNGTVSTRRGSKGLIPIPILAKSGSTNRKRGA